MIARVTREQKMVRLDRAPQLDERVTEEDAADKGRLARMFMRVLRDVAALQRRFWPDRIDFEDRAVTGGDVIRFEHRFGGRARWWIVDWKPVTPGDAPIFERDDRSDNTTLVLAVTNDGLVTVRVEQAG